MMPRSISLGLALVFAAAGASAASAQTPAPTASTGPARGVERTLATLTGSVDPNGVATTYRFEYGTTTLNRRTDDRSAGAGRGAVNASVQVSGLEPGTRYRYRIVAQSEGGPVFGVVRAFTTDRAPVRSMAATTGGVTAVMPTTATLTGRANTRGREATFFFEYGPTRDYGARTPVDTLAPVADAVDVSAPVDALVPGATYHYRLVVQPAAGAAVRGRDRTFTAARVPNGLSFGAARSDVRYGRSVAVSGALAGTGNAGVRIAVQADRFPFGGGWREVASGTTDADGAYAIGVPPLLATSRLRAVAATRPAVTSDTATVAVHLATTLRLGARRVRRGKRVRFRGTVRPAQVGADVAVQRRKRGRWVTVARTVQRRGSTDTSTYRRRVRIRRGGRYRVTAFSLDGAHELGRSAAKRIRIRR